MWFVEEPEESTEVITGNKLELSCKAEASPGITVEYIWFKCVKEDGSDKTPTNYVSNRMTIPVCNDTIASHYICQAVGTMQAAKCDSIYSRVAHVKVVNSTNISTTKEPPSEVSANLGNPLILKCEASCKNLSVDYQWYKGAKPVAGATQSVLNIPAVSEEGISWYYCEVTSVYSATSKKSKITHVIRKKILYFH